MNVVKTMENANITAPIQMAATVALVIQVTD